MMFFLLPTVLAVLLTAQPSLGYNFPYEGIQLKESDVANNSDIAFGKLPVGKRPKCKTFPGDAKWPSDQRWSAFNTSLGGALIRGIPPAAACYEGPYKDAARCAVVRAGSSSSLFAKEDPTIPFGQWQLNNPCPVPRINVSVPFELCNVTSYPNYVVNASTTKHVQLAVNFARNNNIRLTIKNTGHDWMGRNTGGGALQVWVHHMKAFEYVPEIEIGKYTGRAAKVGVALEQHEVYANMGKANITLLAPGSSTVGAYGGFMQGGGFSYITTRYGLMADQVLALEVVTADGRYVHADPEENEDLFFALRGGGPSNYGIVTSVIVKAYPPTIVSRSDFNFQTGPITDNSTTTVRVDNATFWKGIDVYFSHNVRINDNKAIMWNFINTQAPSSGSNSTGRTFTLVNQITKPGATAKQLQELVAPIISELNKVGIPLPNPEPRFWNTYAEFGFRPNGPGEGVGNGRFGSRLFQREVLKDAKSPAFRKAMNSIRDFVEEGGYNFHSVDFAPTYETAGYPGASAAVSPHMRNSVMHATGYDTMTYDPGLTPEQWKTSHARLNSFVQRWRDASPGSGAYMNEADTEEPNFQESFYGDNYDRLLKVKNKRDPWRVFYAVTAVASDEWVVEGTQGLPTQEGRLCRVDE